GRDHTDRGQVAGLDPAHASHDQEGSTLAIAVTDVTGYVSHALCARQAQHVGRILTAAGRDRRQERPDRVWANRHDVLPQRSYGGGGAAVTELSDLRR